MGKSICGREFSPAQENSKLPVDYRLELTKLHHELTYINIYTHPKMKSSYLCLLSDS